MKITALIMAGGRGERFWPRSRKCMPKQFLSLTGDGKTMLQITVERVLPIVQEEDIYVVTNQEYKDLVKEQLPNLPKRNILCEPVAKNTAPCIGFGAIYITNKYKDAIMIVLPSDHLIKYNNIFRNTIQEACTLAKENENLVTIGIPPDHPETGYGYIKFKPENRVRQAYIAERFIEKPDLNTAKKYLQTEEYFWNSGIFIWKASSILKNIKKFLPDTYRGLKVIEDKIGTQEEDDIIRKVFLDFSSESIDYGVMEKADGIYILPSSFGWDDVGSWLAIERIRKSNEDGNVVSGNVICINTKNSIIEGEEKLIAMVGLKDLIVVDTKDAILICNKNATGEIKEVLQTLKISNRNQYL